MKKPLLMLLILLPFFLFAQMKQINGIVTDQKGEAIIGASVLELSTSNGTITDFDGKFTLKVNPTSKLKISYIGFKTVEIAVGSTNLLNIKLSEDTELLDEVVVVAYGSQKKISLTGAIGTVDSKELKRSSAPGLSNALTGMVTGLTTVQSTGLPGSDDSKIYIRGLSSFNNQDPLVLIDGIQQGMDIFRMIDSNELESISVLKDASSTAIFGVRGANGVILVTTKRGGESNPKLQVSMNQSWSEFSRIPERLGMADYMKLSNESATNNNIPTPYPTDVQEKYLNPLLGLDPSDPDYAQKAAIRKYIYPDNDWYKIYFKKFSPQIRFNMNLNGGSKYFKYFVNASYLNQGSNINTPSPKVLGYDNSPRNERYNFRANLDYQISKNLKTSLDLGSYMEKVQFYNTFGGGSGSPASMRQNMIIGILGNVYNVPPFIIGPSTIAYNGVPAGIATQPEIVTGFAGPYSTFTSGRREDVVSNFQNSFVLNWDLGWLTKGLTLRGSVSYDGSGQLTTTNFQELRYVVAQRAGDDLVYNTQGKDLAPTFLAIDNQCPTHVFKINGQFQAIYNRIFAKKHAVTAMILGQQDTWQTNNGEAPYNLIGFAGRFQYGYDERYIGEFDFGYNGSERFSPDKRFGFFPSYSGTWIASNEDFLKENNFLTMLKFRGSYGLVGDDTGIARYLYNGANGNMSAVESYTDHWGLIQSSSAELGKGTIIKYGTIGNPDITWATEKKINLGVDFQLIREIKVSADVYSNNRTGILLQRGAIPAFQGYDLRFFPSANIGAINNKGFEIECVWNRKINNYLSFMLKGSFAYNKNMVINREEVPNQDYAYPNRIEGYSVGQQWGLVIDYSNGNGYFNTQADLDNNPYNYTIGKPRLGDFKYIDQNGDNIIDQKDVAPIGYSSGLPRINYTGSLGINYKNFDFNMLMQGVSQVTVNRNIPNIVESANGFGIQHLHAWTPERYENNPTSISYPALAYSGISTSLQNNSFFYQDASFIRIRNMELVYNIPKKALQFIGLSQARISLNGENLITWDWQKFKNIDPEQSEARVYPLIKTYSIGLNVNF